MSISYTKYFFKLFGLWLLLESYNDVLHFQYATLLSEESNTVQTI